MYKKLQAVAFDADNRKALAIREFKIPTNVEKGQILVKVHYLGVNATNNLGAAKIMGVSELPFDIGLESLGVVEKVGANVQKFEVGQPVMAMGFGKGFSEYLLLDDEKELIPIPELDPKYVSLLVSGITATMSLDISGKLHLGPEKSILITSATAGSAIIAIQWAKRKECIVIAATTNASEEKFLRSIGTDHVVTYTGLDSFDENLAKQMPSGFDFIWDTLGAEYSEMLLAKHLAPFGRLSLITAIHGVSPNGYSPVVLKRPFDIIFSSRSVAGFLASNYPDQIPKYVSELIDLVKNKKLTVVNDFGERTSQGEFIGLESSHRAIEHVMSGKSVGKVTIKLV